MEVTLVRYTVDPVNAIESAASNCYNSSPSKQGVLMKDCYNNGHHSVLEFAQFHFHITGISRACLAQLTRHRTSSFAVRSQRYVNEDGCKFVTPKSIQHSKEAMCVYTNALTSLANAYSTLCALEIPNEDARFILPNACETVVDVSSDFRNLIHFMNERLCTRAQWEIRELAQKMKSCVVEVCPITESMLVPKCESYKRAFCQEAKSCGKHKRLEELIHE